MRIACLQFAPQVGDVDNNLNRADAVLAKANQDDIDSLDLLVLPELAFSGFNFGSYDEISPFLEPSGSGISSLWARTVALKHNLNVLVGYPEKLDASGNSRAGPKHFNSAILVNGDGETVANYRKSFLHSVDETWALEGKGFFGGHVPGLGNTAIGIGSDMDPYRLEAPWHAFEFAFHILDVRANLAIVNMAWTTEEDCEQFTQFPNEPDMETLTYWAQRLEPVIRDESRDELVIVFGNRTGIEDADTVYAGTSAVIGIYQGEVKVYGLLGRGVKELLVVDTDKPPFANLTIRKSKMHLSPLEYELKTSGSLNGPHGLMLKPSPVNSGWRNATRDPSSAKLQYAKTGSNPLIKESHNTPLPASSTPEKVVPDSPECSTPTASNSMSEATGQQASAEPRQKHDTEARGIDIVAPSFPGDAQILGGSLEITFEDDSDAHDDQDEEDTEDEADADAKKSTPTRSFASPPPPPDHALPPGSQLPRFPHKPTIVMQYPTSEEASNLRESSLKLGSDPSCDHSTESHGPSTSRVFPDRGLRGCTRPSTATGARPSRPSSPKSRNVSRSGRSNIVSTEILVLDRGDMVPEFPHRRTQSVVAERREHDTNSPITRSMSRPIRDVGLDQSLIERALDFYLGSMSVDARERLLAASNRTARSANRQTDDNSTRSDSTEPSSLRGNVPSSDQISSSATSESARSKTSSPGSEKGTDQSRPMLWKEDSQLVGQHVRRSNSPDDARGRRRSRSPTSMAVRRASIQPRSPSRSQAVLEQRGRSAAGRFPISRFQAGNGGAIRTIRDPSLGPPDDPEDEIIAEITFRRPCQNCGSPSCGSKGSAGPNAQKAPSPNREKAEETPENVLNSPGAEASSPVDSEKTPTLNSYRTAHQGLARLALQTSVEDLDDLRAPSLSRGSFRTLSSYEPSPVTPPPRRFEPRTPKAMIFNQDHLSQLPTDLGSRIRFDAVDALLDEIISANEGQLPGSLL